MLSNPNLLLAGVVLVLLQFLAALPWLRAIDPRGFDRTARSPQGLGYVVLGVLGAGVLMALFIGYKADSASLGLIGRIYGAALHLQLLIGLFLLAPQLLILVWPKGGAVALAAYREGWRNPMFWLITVFAVIMMAFSIVFPYFTFQDDYKMMKQIGFDVIMLSAALFGVLSASMSISDEIEGRTAITLLSKPVNRRQFLIGKFLGILMACVSISLILGWFLNWALLAMPEFDKINEVVDPMPVQAKQELAPYFLNVVPGKAGAGLMTGAANWFCENFAHSFGVLLGFGQVMILVAIASALATRLAFVLNVVICLVVYFLGHLAPVVVRYTQTQAGDGGAGVGLVRFLGQLFDTLLPALEFFNMGPAIIRETPLNLWSFAGYSLTVFGYSVLYTCIALVVGLLLFEDRDLA